MNGQQFFLGLVAVALMAIAIPGLVMEGGSGGTVTTAGTTGITESQADDLNSVPETRLAAIRVGEKRRAEIEFQRKVNINTISQEGLANSDIPNLGGARAEALITFRDKRKKPIKCLSQLTGAKGIGDAYLEDWQEYLTVGKKYQDANCSSIGGPTKVNPNTANKQQLAKLNGVGPATAEAIIKYRQKGNTFTSPEDLDAVDGIGPKTVEGLRDQLILK